MLKMKGRGIMNIELEKVRLPEFGVPEGIPEIPAHLYEERCIKAYKAADCEWLVVYGDREHFANIHYLCGYDPRFEEALSSWGLAAKNFC